jgi:hypothetical protein
MRGQRFIFARPEPITSGCGVISPPGRLYASLRDCSQERKLSRDQVIRSDDVMKPVGSSRRAHGNRRATPDEVCGARKAMCDYRPHRAHADKSLEAPFKTEYDIVMQQQDQPYTKSFPRPSFFLITLY